MRMPRPSIRKVVLATTPDDSHLWNLAGVQLELEERGFSVTNLGPCTPVALLSDTLAVIEPELLVISSINGHGGISIVQMLRDLTSILLLTETRVVAGGLLCTDQARSHELERLLLSHGCHAIFTGEHAWPRFDAWLQVADEEDRKTVMPRIAVESRSAGVPRKHLQPTVTSRC